MKLLPNINKSVPEAADPALIKPVSDALEALDTALGAKPSTLTTTAKTLVGAINEVAASSEVICGSTDNIYWEKHADGRLTCYGEKDFLGLSVTTVYGNGYMHDAPLPITFPVTFVGVYAVNLTVVGSSLYIDYMTTSRGQTM